MSKELIDPYWVFENHKEAAELIEQQQSWIASLEQHAKDADRLWQKREAEFAAELRVKDLTIGQMANDMAAAQAQRDELLAVVKDFDSLIQYQYTGSQEAMSALQIATWAAHDVLAQPSDDSALREMLKQERERCIDVIETYRIPVGNSAAGEMACEWTYDALHEIRDQIRAMEDK